MTLRVFGLTGGIGTGKSTVAGLLRERGIPVVDADQLAREVVAPGSQGLHQVVEAFGPEVLAADGSLDRKAVASLVFADSAARKRLNAITHPLVRELSQARFAALDAQGVTLAAYDVPLLFEVGLDAVLRPVVVVAAGPDTQVARVRARDGLSDEAVRQRMAAQLPIAEKKKRADFVIDNDGTPDELERAVDELVQKLRAAA